MDLTQLWARWEMNFAPHSGPFPMRQLLHFPSSLRAKPLYVRAVLHLWIGLIAPPPLCRLMFAPMHQCRAAGMWESSALARGAVCGI